MRRATMGLVALARGAEARQGAESSRPEVVPTQVGTAKNEPHTSTGTLVDYPDYMSGHFGPFDAALDEETPDPNWAATVQRAVAAEYADAPGIAVESVSCGTSFCRLEISTTEDDKGGRNVTSRLHKIPVFEAELAPRMSQPPAPPKMVIYFSKKGIQLPSLH